MLTKQDGKKSISDQVRDAISTFGASGIDNQRLLELESLKKTMIERGLLKKKGFGLPPIDTIGRTAYNSFAQRQTDNTESCRPSE